MAEEMEERTDLKDQPFDSKSLTIGGLTELLVFKEIPDEKLLEKDAVRLCEASAEEVVGLFDSSVVLTIFLY